MLQCSGYASSDKMTHDEDAFILRGLPILHPHKILNEQTLKFKVKYQLFKALLTDFREHFQACYMYINVQNS